MSPRTPEQNEKIREEKRKLIKNTALKLFSEHGYYLTSIAHIAREAGISKGLIYNYYDSKKEILIDIFKALDGIIERMFSAIGDKMETEEDFRTYVDVYFQTLSEQPDFWKMVVSMGFQKEVSEELSIYFNSRLEIYIKMVVQYYNAKGDPTPFETSMVFHSLLDGMLLNFLLSPDLLDIERIKDIIVKRFA